MTPILSLIAKLLCRSQPLVPDVAEIFRSPFFFSVGTLVVFGIYMGGVQELNIRAKAVERIIRFLMRFMNQISKKKNKAIFFVYVNIVKNVSILTVFKK